MAGSGRPGAPRTGIVWGPPGVGKSHLLRAMADRAGSLDFRVLRGAGFEGTPPLLPVLTALEPLAAEARAGPRQDMGETDRLVLDRLVGSRAGSSPTSTPDDTALFLTASRLVVGAAHQRPVLLIIDDAHALDGPSAAMIGHLAAAATHQADGDAVALLLVIAARTGPLSAHVRRAVSRLRHEQGTTELALDGLDEVALNELLLTLGPVGPSRPLLHEIQSRTGGNPLFARLLWKHLVDHGAARVVDGRVVATESLDDPSIDLDLDDVIDVQLGSLSAACREVLKVASVLGPTGDVEVLASVAGLDPARVEEALVEAQGSGVCRQEGAEFRFEHPLVVAAVGRLVTPGDQRELHARTARVLAELSRPPMLKIVGHLHAAGPLAPQEERLRWGRAGAERAMAIGAWGTAVTAFDLALAVVDEEGVIAVDDGRSPPGPRLSPEELSAMFRGAVAASAADHDLASCERFATAAVDHARAHDDLDLWCDVAIELGHARIRVAQGGAGVSVVDLKDLLERLGDEMPHQRARVLALLAEAHFAVFDFAGGLEHALHADHLAKTSGHPEIQAFVHFALALQHQGRFELDESDERFAVCQRLGTLDGQPGDLSASGWARARVPSARWIRGQLAEAELSAGEAMSEAEARLDRAELSLIQAWRACVAGARGEPAQAVRLAEKALVLHHRSDYAFTPIVAQPALAFARAMQGNSDGAHEGLARWRAERPSRWIDRLDVLVDVVAGNVAAVAAAVESGRWRPIAPATLDLASAATAAGQVEVAAVVGSAEMAAPVRRPLEGLHARGVRFVPGSLSLVSRLCSVAARITGDLEKARYWIGVARRDAEVAGALGEAARCDMSEAVLVRLEGGGADEVDGLLTSASAGFDRLGMLALLHRCEHELGAVGRAASVRSRKVVLFTDLVGSTSINARTGDDLYLSLLRAHDRVVRASLRRHHGVEFKHTGDGLAAWFASPRQAVRCALELHGAITAAVFTDTGAEVAIRCGLAVGEPIEVDGDLFGLAVAQAARICARSRPGGVLVSDDLPLLVGDDGIAFVDRGEVELRGFPDAVRLFEAHMADKRRPVSPASGASRPERQLDPIPNHQT